MTGFETYTMEELSEFIHGVSEAMMNCETKSEFENGVKLLNLVAKEIARR